MNIDIYKKNTKTLHYNTDITPKLFITTKISPKVTLNSSLQHRYNTKTLHINTDIYKSNTKPLHYNTVITPKLFTLRLHGTPFNIYKGERILNYDYNHSSKSFKIYNICPQNAFIKFYKMDNK